MIGKIRNYKNIVPLSYGLFFVIAFILFLTVTFPGDVVKQRIISEIQKSTPYKVEINHASVSPLLNVDLSEVKIYRSQDQFIELDQLTIKPSLFSVFSDTPSIPFKAKLMGGEIEGDVKLNKINNGVQEMKASVKQVRVDSIPALLSGDGEEQMLINGVLDGEFDVKLQPEPSGDFSFVIEGLSIDNLKVKEMKLPALSNLRSNVKGNIGNDLTNVEELSIKGEGLDIQITGTAPLVWELSEGGILDLGYRVEITDGDLMKYKSFLSPYLARHRDGSLGGKILGTVMNPRFEKGSVTRF